MNYSVEANLLGAMFFYDGDPKSAIHVDEAATALTADDFAEEFPRKVFTALVRMRKAGKSLDLCGLVSELEIMGENSEQAVVMATATIIESCPLPDVAGYIRRVKELSRARKLERTIGLANERLSEGQSVSEVKADLVFDIETIESDQQSQDDQLLADVAMPVLNALADRAAGDHSKRGLQTSIEDLDMTTTGINAGELWVVGAMPGRGKTAFAIQVALNVAGHGFPVYFISLEMSTEEIFRRTLKTEFGPQVVDRADKFKTLEYAADLRTIPLHINDSSSMEISELTAHARIKIARDGINLVIVDYLQLIRGAGRDRRERVGDATDALRRLAKDTGVPVMALSQLRRPEKLNDRPSMIDLKESGDIEAHAHVVLLLYGPVDDRGAPTGEDDIIIGKQREGPTGSVPVYFERSRGKFHRRETHA
jgi:replicative DNA helicase